MYTSQVGELWSTTWPVTGPPFFPARCTSGHDPGPIQPILGPKQALSCRWLFSKTNKGEKHRLKSIWYIYIYTRINLTVDGTHMIASCFSEKSICSSERHTVPPFKNPKKCHPCDGWIPRGAGRTPSRAQAECRPWCSHGWTCWGWSNDSNYFSFDTTWYNYILISWYMYIYIFTYLSIYSCICLFICLLFGYSANKCRYHRNYHTSYAFWQDLNLSTADMTHIFGLQVLNADTAFCP